MNLKEFELAPFYNLDKEWALLTVGNKDLFNMMTISWGGFGTLWHKPVVTIYVRKSRYSYEILQNEEYFTVSFYDDDYKKVLGILGSHSGREINKMDEENLTPIFLDKGVAFLESKLTIVAKKIYEQELDINGVPDEYRDDFYKDDEMHMMIIGEVVDISDKRK